MMGSNNYLGLTHHPELLAAARAALKRYGSGCTGSRFLNGTLDLHEQLETELAEFFGKESCLVFSTGYQANLGVISGLVGRADLVFLDKLDHASIVDGAKMSHGETQRFNHGDLASLERKLQKVPEGTGTMIIVDGVYSMEGDIADVPGLLKLSQKHGAALAIDDAHPVGILGPNGDGTAAHYDLIDEVDLPVWPFPYPHAATAGRHAVAGLRYRPDRDAHHSGPDRPAREDVPLLAQAVRCRRVHEPGGATRGAAVTVPPAHQPDGDPHGRPDRPRPRGLRAPRERAGGHLTAVEIVPVSDGRGLDRFIAFPYDHYRDDPLWVPQLRRDMRTLLSPAKNPFFQHAEAQYWMARDPNGRIIGRIGAIKNDMHNREHNDRVGFYGFFESINDQAVATALWDTAAAWLRAKGFDTMRGPMSPSVNDECGLLIANNGTPPSLMMPYNFAYYEQLHERYGFRKAKDLLAFDGGGAQMAPERFVRLAQRAGERRGIKLRTLDMKRFDAEVELIKALYNSAWEKNWGFVPLTEAEIDHLAKQLKPIVVPDLVIYAELEGRIVGFGVGLPDFNLALLHNRSGRMFPGILKVLWHARKIHRARILLLGVIPEFRGRGVDALLYQKVWENSVKHGMPSGEAGWILEDNALMNKAATQLGFRVSKTFRIYDKPL